MTTPQTDAQAKELKAWRPEPWFTTLEFPYATTSEFPTKEDVNRIVQCVNACAGLSDPQSAIDAAREALRGIAGDERSGEATVYSVTASEYDAARKALALLEGKK